MNTPTLSPPVVEGEILDTSIVDGLVELCDGDDEFMNQVLDLYVESFATTLQAIRDSVASADASALHRSAHTLKGASANIGARRIAALAETLQQLGQGGETEGADPYVVAIEEEYPKALTALSGYFPSFQP